MWTGCKPICVGRCDQITSWRQAHLLRLSTGVPGVTRTPRLLPSGIVECSGRDVPAGEYSTSDEHMQAFARGSVTHPRATHPPTGPGKTTFVLPAASALPPPSDATMAASLVHCLPPEGVGLEDPPSYLDPVGAKAVDVQAVSTNRVEALHRPRSLGGNAAALEALRQQMLEQGHLGPALHEVNCLASKWRAPGSGGQRRRQQRWR